MEIFVCVCGIAGSLNIRSDFSSFYKMNISTYMLCLFAIIGYH